MRSTTVVPASATSLVARAHLWTLTAGAALVLGAWWLRSPGIRYLAIAIAATTCAGVMAMRLPHRSRRWAGGAAAAMLVFCVLAIIAQRQLDRIADDWTHYRASLIATGESDLANALAATSTTLHTIAEHALDAPAGDDPAFHTLARSVSGHDERGVVLYRRGRAAAWGGRIYIPTDSLTAPQGVVDGPFYVTLYAVATRGDARAVATAVVSADPPGDRLTDAVGNRIAQRIGLQAFDVFAPIPGRPVHAGGAAGGFAYAPAGDTLLVARAVAPGEKEAQLLALERVRLIGSTVVGIALLLFLIAAWRQEQRLRWRLAPLAVALIGVALVPLSAFSSVSTLFDPTVYYAEFGGPFTANAGALTAASAIVLLGLLIVLRARTVPIRSRGMVLVLAVLAVAAIVGGGPLLLRALSRGVSPPAGGVTDQLWLAWEVSLFLAATSLLVIAAAAGNVVLGLGRRGRIGLSPIVAPAIAALAAFLGPIVLQAPGTWPEWYTALWIAALGALALSRPHRWLVLTAATVAALGATTLTWSAGVRGRTALANRDVAGLGTVQPDLVAVVQRFGDLLTAGDPPQTEADLVHAYMQSYLVGSGYPVALESWISDDVPGAQVMLDPMTLPSSDVIQAVTEARLSQHRIVRPVLGVPGMFLLLAVPYSNGAVITVVVAPPTRLIPDDPFNALLGIEDREQGEPPYAIALVPFDSTMRLAPNITRWYRSGTALHGDHLVETARGPMRAHIEVELRSQAILVQRGTLVVLLDLVIIIALWTLSALPERAFWRWTRWRVRRWMHSFRARLTIVLFGFFVLPALAFALWSYQRLQTEDQQSRALLVRETLRASAGGDGADAETVMQPLDMSGDRLGTPLLLYRGGELRQTSAPLFDALAPTGRFIPPAVDRRFREHREVYTSESEPVAGAPALFGYLSAVGPDGEPLILGAPAPGREDVLDQRRRDLGVLVLFATVLGAIAALWLSRIASRSLAEPIGRLRQAALAIAGGEREPPLAGRPPEEFDPVFSAFRRMAADLGASRAALESAQRRTTAVLRNVASGVVALSGEGAVLLANPRAEALLNRRLPPGTAVAEVHPIIAHRLQTFLAGDADEEEFELTLAGRQTQARLTRLGDGAAGAVLTLDDVTELARAQRVLAWGEMARQVAHEIKNPLTPIRLGVQHLKRAYADTRADFDQILDKNAQRILEEIDRLDEIARSFSRYGTAPAEQRPAEPVDVVAVVRDVMELERLGGAGGHIDWRLVDSTAPAMAMARREELREVLLNVFENARLADATRVEVRCARCDGRVALEVTDDGRGIPPAVLPRIFEPHFSTRTSGSGLGLAVSRQLIESWGGEIAIASREGEGTTVRIELKEK